MALENGKLLKCPIDAYVKDYNMFKHSQLLPWVMYCYFESILVPIKDAKYSDKHVHQVSSYCYNVMCRERPSFNKFKLYRVKNEKIQLLIIFLMILKIY